jgi:hypothetical protein
MLHGIVPITECLDRLSFQDRILRIAIGRKTVRRRLGYSFVKPQRFAATLLSQQPLDKHLSR